MVIPGIRGLGLWPFLKLLGRRALDNAVLDRAATLAYYFLFALFPFIFFLVTLTAYLPLKGATDQLLSRLQALMPRQAFAIVQGHLHDLLNNPRPHLLTLGIVIALWSASSGVDALRAALNLSYDVKESRPLWKTRGVALLLTVIGAVAMLAAVAMMVLGGKAGFWLANHAGFSRQYLVVWAFLRWPATALVILTTAAVLYYLLPDVKQEFRFITPGSLAGTALWLVSTWAFTQYAEHFGSYNATYGSIGGVIVLMTWLYITGLVFILGGETNAIIEHASADGKARGARAAGEAAPPAIERPSVAAPGATQNAQSAERSQAQVEKARAADRSADDDHGPTLH